MTAPVQRSQPSTEHAPTPWQIGIALYPYRHFYGSSDKNGAALAIGSCVTALGEKYDVANAAFIVEAVNSHASLKARVEELESEDYLVWSNQHRAWWRPNSCGYTTDIRSAGRYSRDEAISISGQSRDGWGKPNDLPEELAIPISALPKNIRAALPPIPGEVGL